MQPIPYFGEKLKGGWLYEPKIDGWRMQILHYKDGKIECWGRRLERVPNWTDKLKNICVPAKRYIPRGTILDCELSSDKGRRFIPSLFAKAPKAKPIVYVFDVIFCKDKCVCELPLYQRKKILAGINLQTPFILLMGERLKNLEQSFEAAVKNGAEGIVIKKVDSPYIVGKGAPIATHYWRKIK